MMETWERVRKAEGKRSRGSKIGQGQGQERGIANAVVVDADQDVGEGIAPGRGDLVLGAGHDSGGAHDLGMLPRQGTQEGWVGEGRAR
jgi:hypothetical protein